MFWKSLFVGCVLALSTWQASADELRPAVVYGVGGKFDKSFNEGAYNGARRFTSETGLSFRDFEPQSVAQGEQALERFARSGFSPIIAMGFQWQAPLKGVAARHPDTQFVIVDTVVDEPNVRSLIFKEHEGSYLVGLLAAMASQTKAVGFIGGMDIPPIRRFGCGFFQGAAAGGAERFVENMTGSTPSAFNDPVRGGEIAKTQIDRGVDVIFAAAGGTGLGVLQAAADRGVLSVGVDYNQNGLHPGLVLTSMLKKADQAVYDALVDANAGNFSPGLFQLGLKEGGVDWSLDENNRPLITEEMEAAMETAKAEIISGQIVVHDFTSTMSCPVQ